MNKMRDFKVFTCILFFILVTSTNIIGGPIYTRGIKLLDEKSDLVCVGVVTKVVNNGVKDIKKEVVDVRVDTNEGEELIATFQISKVFKSSIKDKTIKIKCWRNLNAWLPGISKYAFIAFLKKGEGGNYLPVQQPGYLIAIDSKALENDQKSMQDILKYSIKNGADRRIKRQCLDILEEITDKREYLTFLNELTSSSSEYVKGLALLHLNMKEASYDKSSLYILNNYKDSDEEIRNIAKELKAISKNK